MQLLAKFKKNCTWGSEPQGHSVATVTYCVVKIIIASSPVIGQFFDTMIVASIDKEW